MTLFKICGRKFCNEAVKNHIFKTGFDSVLKKIDIVQWENGKLVACIKVTKEHTNVIGGLHGGFSATLVDTLSSMALLSHQNNDGAPSVSVNINLSYLKGAKEGDEVLIEANTVRVGKSLAYLTCELKNKSTGDILVQGTHTKYLMRPR